MPEFGAMNHEDLLGFQRSEEGENVTNKRKRNPINDITSIENLVRQLVVEIQPLRSGISHNSPIKIDEEGVITYEEVWDYMALKMNVSYVEKDSEEEHFRVTRSNKIITAYMVDSNGKVKSMVHHSSSQYGGIRIVINRVYIFIRAQMLETMKREISTFIAGMERTVIAEKQICSLKFYEGKKKSASRHMSSLQRHYLKADKIEIFVYIYF